MKEIVIRIPEKTYDVICKSGSGAPLVIDDAIRKGKILPKGHGKLIDVEQIRAYIFRPYSNEESYSNIEIDKMLKLSKTIVEADVCDNDCEHCEWVTCPKAEEGAEE